MPLAPKIDPPVVSRGGLEEPKGVIKIFWQKWFTQVYRTLLYLLRGTEQLVQADLATFAASLDQQDAGILAALTDFNHVLQWTGTGWRFAPGDSGSGYITTFLFAPLTTGWHLCDGTTVTYLKADGATATVLLPDLAESYIRL